MKDKRPETIVILKFKMPDEPNTFTDSGSPVFYNALMAFLKRCRAYDIDFDSYPIAREGKNERD